MKKLAVVIIALAGLYICALAPSAETFLSGMLILDCGFIVMLIAALLGKKIEW